MAADIVGYSRLIESNEAATLATIKALRAEVIDPLLAEHKGRVVKLMGDGALVEFHSVVDAVACAVAVQNGVAAHQAKSPPERRIVFRVGINLGDVVVEGEDLLGDGVNIAARLEQLCPAGGVLISGTAYDHMKGKLGLPLDFTGEQQVKNISEPVRTYSVRMDGAQRNWKLRSRRFRQWLPMAAAALIVLGLAGAGAWWLLPSEPAVAKTSIAVLPFDNIGGDEPTRRLADGITEDIITDLAQFPDFHVIARNSTAVYAGTPIDVRQVGKDLNVRYVLEGSVQRQGDDIRVTAQLIDAASGAHIWSERWDRAAADVFAVQTEIVQQAVNRLGGSGVIMEAEHRAAQRKRPESLSAYEKYLLGRDRILTPTKERVDEAIGLFKQALDEDPTLARAWVDLAWAYDQSTGYGADFATVHPLSVAAARRAVELDPMDAGAHSALGNMIALDGHFSRAKAEFDTALRLNPGSADILAQYAGWASTFGEPERGAELADQAIRMNPNYPPAMSGWFYFAYFMAGRYEDALRILDKQPVENRTMFGWVVRAASYAGLGEEEKAKAAAKEALEHYPDLTAEGFANEPGFNDTERMKLVETMRDAGFPACAAAEKLAGKAKAFRLPECSASAAP
ncbi:adenylate/guanylate cyclase domain-containing protein [Mesorhizobium muleiense]|uniref:adenylate/guanylate cyclase domain-containing protein n=1 Tax=Mesorhizobium muleiense TaxID=1004279 RepID=UPI001F346C6B|nr:adenylate/guanylate cyclase domain-containing protein [Mesorhizobium muleiense]MCF6116037.1 adenylate/guanylate cyclase domain-containing protein [Mesorhizobium muleiense]